MELIQAGAHAGIQTWHVALVVLAYVLIAFNLGTRAR